MTYKRQISHSWFKHQSFESGFHFRRSEELHVWFGLRAMTIIIIIFSPSLLFAKRDRQVFLFSRNQKIMQRVLHTRHTAVIYFKVHSTLKYMYIGTRTRIAIVGSLKFVILLQRSYFFKKKK